MKGISLWQPWAWLMACGAKRIETRSWAWPAASRGQPTLICSTASTPVVARHVFAGSDFQSALALAVIRPRESQERVCCNDGRMLHGYALAVGWPVASLPTHHDRRLHHVGGAAQHMPPGTPEADFGNYSPGRFGILFAGVRALPAPFPIKGGQRVWNANPYAPARALEQIGMRTAPTEPWIER